MSYTSNSSFSPCSTGMHMCPVVRLSSSLDVGGGGRWRCLELFQWWGRGPFLQTQAFLVILRGADAQTGPEERLGRSLVTRLLCEVELTFCFRVNRGGGGQAGVLIG